jgi:hypothetical protein
MTYPGVPSSQARESVSIPCEQPPLSMVRYLLVDNRDGRVLTELASAEQAVRLLGRVIRDPHGDPAVRLMRLDHQQGSLAETTSMVSIRPLPPHMARGRRQATAARPSALRNRPTRIH